VKAHVFASKKDAKQWIDMRHLGSQGGVGIREWNLTQKTRAAGENTKTSARDNTLSVLVLDRLVARGALSQNQRASVNVSTLTRYLGTPGVRAILGLGDNRQLIYTHDAHEVDSALLQFVLDSIEPLAEGGFRVHSRTNSADRLKYANELKTRGGAPSTPLEHPGPAPKPIQVRTQSEKATSGQRRSAVHPDKRKRLIPSDFSISHKDPVLLRLRREALDLEIEKFMFSANYVLRALVEQTMVLFAKKRGRWKQSIGDQALTQACANELREMGVTGKALSVIQKAAGNDATPYSLHSLGHAVHGGSIPIATELKRHFDTWRPSLEAMLEALEVKKA